MASKAGRLNSDRRKRRFRLIIPDEINQILGDWYELAALAFQSFAQCCRFRNRVQPRIKANRQAFAVFCEPACRRIGDEAFIGKYIAISLIANLQFITSVDENVGEFFQDQCCTCRARKACEPAKALGA